MKDGFSSSLEQRKVATVINQKQWRICRIISHKTESGVVAFQHF